LYGGNTKIATAPFFITIYFISKVHLSAFQDVTFQPKKKVPRPQGFPGEEGLEAELNWGAKLFLIIFPIPIPPGPFNSWYFQFYLKAEPFSFQG